MGIPEQWTWCLPIFYRNDYEFFEYLTIFGYFLTGHQLWRSELGACWYWEDSADVQKWLLVLVSARELLVPVVVNDDHCDEGEEEEVGEEGEEDNDEEEGEGEVASGSGLRQGTACTWFEVGWLKRVI